MADDESVVRDFIRSVIKKENLPIADIFEADNGDEALDLALSEKPDLALLDIRMPGLSGLEVSDRLLKENPETAVYIVSAHDEFDYARTAFKSGVKDYLLKPIRPHQLVSIIMDAVERKEACRAEVEDVHPLVKSVSRFVEENLTRQLSLAEIAEAVFISPTHLSRKFKNVSSRSLSSFILEKRLSRAAELLAADDAANITDVAGQVGFDNPSYFTSCFKQFTGMTPMRYRKKTNSKT